MVGDRWIARTAVPYSLPLTDVLAADREFLWFMLGVTLLMSIAGYFATRRIGQNISRLNDFAHRAERGERIDNAPTFPHDELGEISQHIIRLYADLQRTAADRDREHELALHEEQEKIRIKKQLTNNINHELKPLWPPSRATWKPCWPTRGSTPPCGARSWRRAPRRSSGSAACWPTSRPSRGWTKPVS